MGATNFMVVGSGRDAQSTFRTLAEEARYEKGHDGYTGTIAEKNTFVMVVVPGLDPATTPLKDARRLAAQFGNDLLDQGGSRFDDKHGPAACVHLGPSRAQAGEQVYLFFGVAAE